VRRHISFVAAAWLVFQVSVLAVSPFAVCCSVASQAAVDDDECCKGMAPGQICPLHKHRHTPPNSAGHQDGAGGAVLRCGCGSMDPALISLTFGLGILSPPISSAVTFVSSSVPQPTVHSVHQPRSLDPPPPRA